MIKRIEIYDMDGTLVSSSHRFRVGDNGKIDLAYWIENCTPEKIAQDSLLPLAEKYQQEIADPTVYVIIATARYMQEADFNYVRDILGMPNKIVYRHAKNNHMKGADMKIAGLRFLNSLKQFAKLPRRFYEDNKDYLFPVANYLNAEAVFIPSDQGV
jgi:hypothetical protein